MRQIRAAVILICIGTPLIMRSQDNIFQKDTMKWEGHFTTSVSSGILFNIVPSLFTNIGYTFGRFSLTTGLATVYYYMLPPTFYFNIKQSASFLTKNKSSFAFACVYLYEIRPERMRMGDIAISGLLEYQRKPLENLIFNCSFGLMAYAVKDQLPFLALTPLLMFGFDFLPFKKQKPLNTE